MQGINVVTMQEKYKPQNYAKNTQKLINYEAGVKIQHPNT
jgi:hypothetical protein